MKLGEKDFVLEKSSEGTHRSLCASRFVIILASKYKKFQQEKLSEDRKISKINSNGNLNTEPS